MQSAIAPSVIWEKLARFSVFLLFLSVFVSTSGIGIATALLGVASLVLFHKRWREIPQLPLFWPILFFCTAVLLSVLFAEGSGYGKAVGKLRYLAVFLALVLALRKFPNLARQLTWVGVCFSLFLALNAALQFTGTFNLMGELGYFPFGLAELAHSDGKFFHARGLLYHHNPFGFTALLLFHFMLGSALHTSGGSHRVWYWIATAACFISILLSASRGAWLGLAISTLVVILFSIRQISRRNLVALVVALLVAAALFAGPLRKRVTSIELGQNHDRLRLWSISWQLFKESPIIGHGYHHSFAVQRSRFLSDEEKNSPLIATEPHSVYFDLLGSTGLLGISAFLWILISAFLGLARVLREPSRGESTLSWATAGMGCLVAFAISSAFDSHFFHTQTLVCTLFFLAIGQAVTESKQVRTSPASE